ncbi:unnamed protein product [Pleuronectes platessa]|uniref:Uncharacterized protein n=1 Tax=Pleuronectes platessa TaxID=8262 RepID=A0A9N7UVB7_PLEPL|nr:unnamed protein product [Pleuronectes platessa]
MKPIIRSNVDKTLIGGWTECRLQEIIRHARHAEHAENSKEDKQSTEDHGTLMKALAASTTALTMFSEGGRGRDRDTWQATTIAAKDQPAMITNVTTMDAMMGVSSVDHQNIGLKNVHYEGEVAEECEEDEVVDPMDISPRQIDLLDRVI